VTSLRGAWIVTLALAGVVPPTGAFATDWSTAETVTVVTTEYVFTPSTFTFHKGVVYRLHVDNRGKETHEFTAPAFFRAIRMRNPKALDPDRVEIVVQPGAQKDLYFIAAASGTYELTCSDHDWAGMVGSITITP
jgi:uncharacterized cupredoxin-like copper-binding protein